MKKLIPFLFVVFGLTNPAVAALQPAVISGENLLTAAAVQLSSAETKKGMVLVFLSAECPCSNSHIKELKDLAKEFTDFSFVAVHSNVDEKSDQSKPYFEQAELPFPIIEDKGAAIADRFKAFKTPHAFLILPDGTTAYQGGVSNSKDLAKSTRKFLREALAEVQSGKPVETPKGRTLGCVISRGQKNVW